MHAESWLADLRWLRTRVGSLEARLVELLTSMPIRFDSCRSRLPESHGIYRIFDENATGQTLRAGRTKTASGGLRQRVYQNHLMGDQNGNLRAQLVADGVCRDLDSAKLFIRDQLSVQILVVEDMDERAHLEYFMLAVLKPRYCE